jgi:hypothetical protein
MCNIWRKKTEVRVGDFSCRLLARFSFLIAATPTSGRELVG